MSGVKIIAEVGSNYDGSLETAQDYIRASVVGNPASVVLLDSVRARRALY